jgi:hypothetical protein
LGFAHIVEQAASARYNRSSKLSTSEMLVLSLHTSTVAKMN